MFIIAEYTLVRNEEMEEFVELLGHDFWHRLDRVITAKNAVEADIAKEMYIRGFLDYERLVCRKEERVWQ